MRISYSDDRLLEVCDGIIKINKIGISNSIFNAQSMGPDFRVLKLTDYTTTEAKLKMSVDCVFWGREIQVANEDHTFTTKQQKIVGSDRGLPIFDNSVFPPEGDMIDSTVKYLFIRPFPAPLTRGYARKIIETKIPAMRKKSPELTAFLNAQFNMPDKRQSPIIRKELKKQFKNDPQLWMSESQIQSFISAASKKKKKERGKTVDEETNG